MSVNEWPEAATRVLCPAAAARPTTSTSSPRVPGRSIAAGAQLWSPAQFRHSVAIALKRIERRTPDPGGYALLQRPSGDPGFVKHWYPKEIAARDRLAFYSERFEVVELNSSFYAAPPRDSVERWAEVTPDGFRFHVKLHRLLSWHATKPDALPPDMRDGLELNSRGNVVRNEELRCGMVKRMAESMKPLEDAGKLGAFLLQLSPAFRPRDCRLEELDPILDGFGPHPVAVAFRYRAWMKDKR